MQNQKIIALHIVKKMRLLIKIKKIINLLWNSSRRGHHGEQEKRMLFYSRNPKKVKRQNFIGSFFMRPVA